MNSEYICFAMATLGGIVAVVAILQIIYLKDWCRSLGHEITRLDKRIDRICPKQDRVYHE